MLSASPVQIVTNGNMSSMVNSLIIPLDQIFGCTLQANYSGSQLTGTFTVQTSVDHKQDINGNILTSGIFVPIAGSPVTITGNGTWIWNINGSMYPYIQLVYSPGLGDSGTLNAYASIKGV